MEQPAVEAVGVKRRTEGEINVYAVFKYEARGLTVNAVFQFPLYPRHTTGEREKNVSHHVHHTQQLAIQLLCYRGDSLYTNAFPSSFAQMTIVL